MQHKLRLVHYMNLRFLFDKNSKNFIIPKYKQTVKPIFCSEDAIIRIICHVIFIGVTLIKLIDVLIEKMVENTDI